MSVGPWCSGLGEHLRAADWTFPFLKLLIRSTNLFFFVNFIVKGLSNRPQSDGFEEHPHFNLNFNISTVEVLNTREANPRWFWGGRAKQPKKIAETAVQGRSYVATMALPPWGTHGVSPGASSIFQKRIQKVQIPGSNHSNPKSRWPCTPWSCGLQRNGLQRNGLPFSGDGRHPEHGTP